MRVSTILFACILFDGCSQSESIEVSSIRIVKFNQHPTQVDHDRKLVTVNKKDKIIAEMSIYPDNGVGCNSYLFNSNDKYIVIDCNGQWFSIDKQTGEIKNDGWKWLNRLPLVQLGIFRQEDTELYYKLSIGTESTSAEVYKFKDPR